MRIDAERERIEYHEASFSESAARFVFWLLTERHGVPVENIDLQSYLEAERICGQVDYYRLPQSAIDSGYEATTMRYPISAIVSDEDDPRSIQAEVDFAWAGRLDDSHGIFRFLPGANRKPIRMLSERDCVGTPEVTTESEAEVPLIGMKGTIAQSRDDNYQPTDSNPAMRHDINPRGRVMDIGTRAYVGNLLQMGRNLDIGLERELNSRRVVPTVGPGERWENARLRPGDVVRFKHDATLDTGGEYVIETIRRRDGQLFQLALSPQIDYNRPRFVGLPPKKNTNIQSDGSDAGTPEINDYELLI